MSAAAIQNVSAQNSSRRAFLQGLFSIGSLVLAARTVSWAFGPSGLRPTISVS